MSDLRELYQQIILDHNKSPHNFRVIDHPDRQSEGHNPLCGDRVKIFVTLDGDRIADIAFQGSGCAISKASASLMTDAVKGKTIAEAEAYFKDFQAMVTADMDTSPDLEHLGKLAVFSGVREYPMRIKCATLSWHALHAALKNAEKPITTE